MLVKSFEGLTMSDAMRAVKREFGSNAVILSTNEKVIDSNGSKIIEVKAAAAESRQIGAESGASSKDMEVINAHLNVVDQKVSDFIKVAPKESHFHTLETGLQEIKLLLLESLRNKEGTLDRNIPNDLVDLSQHLKVMGLEESHCTELLNHLSAIPYQENDGTVTERSDFYKSHAIRWMHKRIKIAPKWNLSKGSTAVHMLVGPSGSGKTSMIAKLAADFKNEQDAKVLVVSYDNRRIAASEQLRIYSKILGIDFATIDSPSELEKILLEKRDFDLVLIDTAGRNPRSDEDMADLRAFNDSSLPIDTHLILSLTEKQSQMDRSIRSFSSLGVTSMFFSKFDESWTYGEVYNMAQKWSLPLGYFATGQKIPGSFERASRERVLERIFCL